MTERIVTFGGKKPVKGRNICEPEDQRQWQRGGSHSDAETGRLLSLPSQSWEQQGHSNAGNGVVEQRWDEGWHSSISHKWRERERERKGWLS